MIDPHRSYACRCSHCEARRRLPKHPSQYVRKTALLCRSCSKGYYRVDKFRDSGREHAGKTCQCGNYSFPHRRGSLYCQHSPKLTQELMRERYETRAFA